MIGGRMVVRVSSLLIGQFKVLENDHLQMLPAENTN